MIQCNPTQISQREERISKHFPITHLNSPTIFETRNMMLGSVIQLKGVPFDTVNNETINQYKYSWHNALLSLGKNFSILVTQHRHKTDPHLQGEFSQPLLKEINDRYHQNINQDSIFTNDIYITILSRGLSIAKAPNLFHWLSTINSKTIRKAHDGEKKEQIKLLESSTRQLLVSLSAFEAHLLGEDDQHLEHSELLHFLSLFLNAGKPLQFAQPGEFNSVLAPLSQQAQQSSLYPFGHIGQYLSTQRIFFGDCIEFHGSESNKVQYAVMASVKRYASKTSSIMTNNLLRLNCEYLSTNSFFIESKESAQRIIERHRRKMKNVNDPAVSQIAALSTAQDHLASDRLVMGYHHNTLMLIDNNLESLEKNIAQAVKCYSDAGFVLVRETIGQEPAYWAQIPGNTKMIARSALITSENFVDFCPLHNYRMGYRDQNHLGSAVTILKTPSKTPYYFNFHAKGSRNNPSKGHTTIIGGNGSGKTVAMAFFDAQLSRYAGKTFAFDRDQGLEIYLRACGGYYSVLSPAYPEAVNFNPFQLPDTPINRKFCREWMGELIKEENEKEIPAQLSDDIGQCVDYAFEDLPETDRRLTHAVQMLPINFPRWPHLRKWLRASSHYTEGEYAYLFDNEKDDFTMHDKMGFDMTHFLDSEPKNVLIALTMYLFHRLEESFDGRLVTVLLDEGWQYLGNDYWTQKLKKWMPTLRKLNCHLVLATQSPASVIESPIRNIILDNTATHIYFANPQAKREHYQTGFNLTESEFLCIKENNPAKHYFLLKQEHESCLCQLDLSMMPDILPIFSGNRSTIELQKTLREEHGDKPEAWLPEFRKRSSKLCKNIH